jgi:hypothetical protein
MLTKNSTSYLKSLEAKRLKWGVGCQWLLFFLFNKNTESFYCFFFLNKSNFKNIVFSSSEKKSIIDNTSFH